MKFKVGGVNVGKVLFFYSKNDFKVDLWEPGNKTFQRSRIFGMVLFMRGVTDQEGRPAWQRQSGAGAGRDSWSCSE